MRESGDQVRAIKRCFADRTPQVLIIKTSGDKTHSVANLERKTDNAAAAGDAEQEWVNYPYR